MSGKMSGSEKQLQKDTINQLYMIDIMREGMENDDVRLFRGLS